MSKICVMPVGNLATQDGSIDEVQDIMPGAVVNALDNALGDDAVKLLDLDDKEEVSACYNSFVNNCSESGVVVVIRTEALTYVEFKALLEENMPQHEHKKDVN